MESGIPYQDLLDTAVAGARDGAEVLKHYFRRSGLEVQRKDTHDFVTEADHASEKLVIGAILDRFPDHRILAEESGQHTGEGEEESAYEWFVDPLDGTSNFLQGLPVFCISVGCRHQGEMVAAAVLDPMGDNLFTATRGGGALWNGNPMRISSRGSLSGGFLATGYPFRARSSLELYLKVFRDVFLVARGIRRCGSAALDLAYTAAGVYDGFFEFRLSPWDFAAGVLLVRESGGKITDLDGGTDFFYSGNLIAGPEQLHKELLAAVRNHADEAKLHGVHPLRNNPASATVE